MRISITGPQCCGKTTTLNALKTLPELAHYVFVDEPIRKLVKEKGIKINKEATFEDQMIILQEHHLNALKYDHLISDRSAIDAFSYATLDYIHGKYNYAQWKEFRSLYNECIKMYDRVYLLEPLPMKDDGFRSLDIEWQKETFEIMHRILINDKINFTILPDWNAEGRIKIFREAL